MKVRSLSQSLTYRIMAVVLVMITVIAGIVFFTVREYMLDEAQERYLSILLRNYEDFRRQLSDISVAAQNNIHDIERDIDHPDMMYDHMERIVRQNPTVKSSSILFAPGHYPDKPRYFVPMFRRDSLGVVSRARVDSAYSYQHAKWYRMCMEGDSGLWAGSYFDMNRFPHDMRRIMLTTYATPVHDHQGTPVGVFCVRLSIVAMQSEFMKAIQEVNDKYEKGQSRKSYCFVIDSHGNYIIHPDESRTLLASIVDKTKETPDSLDDRVVARMVRGEDGEAMMEVDGVRSWIYYRTLKHVGWTLAIVVPEEVIFHKGRMLNTILMLAMLLGMFAIYFICRHMIRQTTQPLHRFALSAGEVAKGNFQSQLPDVSGHDEVRLLHDAFSNMQHSLTLYVEQLQKVVSERASMEQELKIAGGIQMAMLPKTFPPFPERSDIDLYASVTAARDVGGDLYDYFIRDNRLFFCIGDVSGKGIPAALMMAVVRAMFRSEARRNDSAQGIIEMMNHNLSHEYTAGYFVTMFAGILDLATGRMDYCNAGHEAPLINGKPMTIKPNLPVGALSDWQYDGEETALQSGDMLFLYTDGLTEAMNSERKLFGRQHLKDIIASTSDYTPRELAEIIYSKVREHAGDTEQSDDITLLAIKWQQAAGSPLQLKIRADMDGIDQLTDFVSQAGRQTGLSEKETKRLRLALEEAVANVINYSEATYVALDAEKVDNRLRVCVTDDGKPFDPTVDSTTDFSLPPDQRPPGGLGIMFLHQMTEALDYQRNGDLNVLTIYKNI